MAKKCLAHFRNQLGWAKKSLFRDGESVPRQCSLNVEKWRWGFNRTMLQVCACVCVWLCCAVWLTGLQTLVQHWCASDKLMGSVYTPNTAIRRLDNGRRAARTPGLGASAASPRGPCTSDGDSGRSWPDTETQCFAVVFASEPQHSSVVYHSLLPCLLACLLLQPSVFCAVRVCAQYFAN